MAIQFLNNVNADNGVLYVDAINNNVGIGTTSPSSNSKLEVIGKGDQLGSTGFYINSSFKDDTNVGVFICHDDTVNTTGAIAGINQLSFITYGGTSPAWGERMKITGAGNVGIGTTSPSEKLHIYNGTAYVTPISYAANQSAYALKIGAYNNTAFDMGLQAKSTSGGSPYMSFKTSSADDTLTIWGGSVGVGGIGIPSYTLDVNGVIRGEQYLRLADTAGTNQFSIRAESTYGTLDNGSKTFNYIASNHLFLVGVSEKMRINSSGNVGIGTTSPSQKLDVAGDATFDGRIYTNVTALASVGILGKAIANGWAARYDSNGANYSGFFFNTNHDASMYLRDDSGNTNVLLRSDTTSYLNGGNVGIGTTSPSYTLDVNGEGRFGDNGGILLTDDSGTSYVRALNNHLNLRTTRDADDIYFSTGTTPTTKMFIEGDTGDVGIGTTGPAQKLHVIGNSEITGDIFLGRYIFHNDDNNTWLGFPLADTISFRTNGSDRMYINSSGNVGIGTTSPGAKLDIFNTGGSAGSLADCQTYSALTIKPYSSVDSKLTFSANGISTQLIQATNNAGTTGRQISLQPFSGNVGIGVILPSEKLDVNGHIKAFNGYKGYVSDFNNGGFFHSPRSTDGANPLFIPINSTGMTSSDQYYNTWVPLYAGRVRKIILKHVSGSTPVATVCTFRKKINGVLSGTTYAGTVTNGGAVGMKVTFDFGTSNFTFNAEDEVQIGVVTGVATQPRMGGMSYQIWYEYNVT